MYDAMFIIPVLQCVWLLFGVLGGEVFFKEYQDMTDSEAVMFTIGVVILLVGISTLRPSTKSVRDGDMDIEMDNMEEDGEVDELDEEKQQAKSNSIDLVEETMTPERDEHNIPSSRSKTL